MSEFLGCLCLIMHLVCLTNIPPCLFIGFFIYRVVCLGIPLLDFSIYYLENFVRIYLDTLKRLVCLSYARTVATVLGAGKKNRINNYKNFGGGYVDKKDRTAVNFVSQEVSESSPCAESENWYDHLEEPQSADEMPGDDQIIKAQRHYEKQAYFYIDKALAIDETHDSLLNKLEALPHYQKGIDELQKGINVVILGEGTGYDRARKLKMKMQRNLEMVTERMQHLDSLKKSSPNTSNSTQQSTSSEVKDKQFLAQPKSLTPTRSTAQKRVSSPGRSLIPRCSSQIQVKNRPVSTIQKPWATSANDKLSNLKNVDKKMLDLILNEISDNTSSIRLSDIAGQEVSKQALYEIVLLPSLRPELFTGLRSPAKGLLLFGPPGNGKTMLAQAVAHESGWVFFNISAASLTSKWVGEGEKLVRALFAAAKHIQKAIIFIDEIDSLFCERKEGEQEASRRLKTQFMIEFSQVDKEQILVIGATNRPFDLDDAVLRRFPKRIYVPMPDVKTRFALLENLLQKQNCSIPSRDIEKIARLTEGYSASDLTSLAKDSAMGPIRELKLNQIKQMDASRLRDINLNDFNDSLRRIRPSVPKEALDQLEKWNSLYGDTNSK